MRCPFCMHYANNCACAEGSWKTAHMADPTPEQIGEDAAEWMRDEGPPLREGEDHGE